MARKSSLLKSVLGLFSLKKLMKKVKFLTKGNNMNKVLLLISILLVLYLVYNRYLKEGFETQAEDLEETLASEDKCLVLFHAEWCGHCKKLMPEWDEAASEINAMESGVKLRKVECGKPGENESHKMLMEKYSIQGYPTIKYFENGEAKEYTGERSKDGLKSFLGV